MKPPRGRSPKGSTPRGEAARSSGGRTPAPKRGQEATTRGAPSRGTGSRATGAAPSQGPGGRPGRPGAAPRDPDGRGAGTRRPPGTARPGTARPTDGGSRRVAGGWVDLGGEQVEGRQAVVALLTAGRRRARDVWITKGQDRAPVLDRILKAAARLQVPVKEVSRDRMEAEARTEAPQGVLAHAAPLVEADFDELITGSATVHPGPTTQTGQPGRAGPMPFVLALDGVTDPHNVGALLRSAEAAGATGAVIPRRRAVNVTPTVAKTAAGAIEYLDLASVPGLPAAVSRARDLGCWVVGLHAEADHSIYDVDPALVEAPLMVVVGSEGKGLSDLVRRRCDMLLRIPMAGSTESLNVSVAGAVALFEIGRRRHLPGSSGPAEPSGTS